MKSSLNNWKKFHDCSPWFSWGILATLTSSGKQYIGMPEIQISGVCTSFYSGVEWADQDMFSDGPVGQNKEE